MLKSGIAANWIVKKQIWLVFRNLYPQEWSNSVVRDFYTVLIKIYKHLYKLPNLPHHGAATLHTTIFLKVEGVETYYLIVILVYMGYKYGDKIKTIWDGGFRGWYTLIWNDSKEIGLSSSSRGCIWWTVCYRGFYSIYQ